MTKPRAFTLLEVLLATVLLTSLMVGALAVISRVWSEGLSTTEPADGNPRSAAHSVEAWAELLREDIELALAIRSHRPDEIMLIGPCGIDARSMVRTHRPVLVLYALQNINGKRWMVRQQAALDVPNELVLQSDLVLCCVSRIELLYEGLNEPPSRLSDGTVPPNGADASAGEDRQERHRPDNSVRIYDTYFPRANLPDWADSDMPSSEWIRREDRISTPVTGEDTENPQDDAVQKKSWRLRVWIGEASEAAVDRILAVD